MHPVSYETIAGERRRAIRHIARLRRDKNRLLSVVEGTLPLLTALTESEMFAGLSRETQVTLTELINASRDILNTMEPEEEFEPE